MNHIKSKKIYLLPLVYRQFISKNKSRGISISSLFLEAKRVFSFNYKSPNKNQPAFIFDYLIVGSNMILNLLIINTLIKEKKINKKINVGLFLPKELDYWSYELIKENFFLNQLEKFFNLNDPTSIENVVEKLIEEFNNNNLNLFFLDERFRINYVEYDNYTKSAYFWFDNKKNNIAKNEQDIEDKNKIKNFVNKKIINMLKKQSISNKLIWDFDNPFARKNDGEKNNNALAIAKNVHISSLPQGWLSLESNVVLDKVLFTSKENYNLYGTAKVIYLNRESMSKNYFEDLIDTFLNKN